MKAVEVSNLKYSYLGSRNHAINIPHFSIDEGECVLITGRSGSGKSTLIQCINGIIPHIINGSYSGEVKIFGKSTREMRVAEIAGMVGTLLQDPERQVINYKVEEEIAFAPENFNIDREEILRRIDSSIEAVGIENLRGKETGKLSGGELQRVALAAVLTMNPKVLILDEPTSNIDPEGTGKIFEFLTRIKGERTAIIVEHKVERVLPLVDRIVVVDNGGIALNIPKEDIYENTGKLLEMGIEMPEHLIITNRDWAAGPKEKKRAEITNVSMKADVSVQYRQGFSLKASLEIGEGTITAIMGKNGAGKSSLLKGLIGFIDQDQGELSTKISIDGNDFVDPDLNTRGRFIGYLPQSFDLMLINKSVQKEINYSTKVRKLKGMEPLVERLVDLFSLKDYLGSDPLTLSQGQRRRVAMASTIAGGPRVIMMDEPTSGQDYFHKRNLGRELTLLKSRGYSFLIVTHDSRFVYNYSDRILLMNEGEVIVEGTPEQVFAQSEKYGVILPEEFLLRWKNELPA
ncbi:hypothetical protein IX51_02720 [uncultured archaeon]|nr:hypothetical protein IX51_02720 [uncultured archaeon]